MKTVLSLLVFALLFWGAYVLLAGWIRRKRGKVISRALRWPVGVGLILASVALANVVTAVWPPEKVAAMPTPSATTVAAEPAPAAKSQDLATQPQESSPAPEPSVQPMQIGLFLVKCRNEVKAQLKSPSTARFVGLMEQNAQTRELPDGGRTWAGEVQSQNGFGSMVRTGFVCVHSVVTGDVSVTMVE